MRLKRQQRKPTKPIAYPSGTCVRTEAGTFYIKNGKRYAIISDRILDSHSFPRIVSTTEAAVSKFKLSGKVGFRDGTFIWCISDGLIYLIEASKRRRLDSPDVLRLLGATGKNVVCVSLEELNLHKEGEPISL